MKKTLLLALMLVAFYAVTFAQNRKPEWATIKTPNLRCWECKKRLEDYMSKEISQNESGILKMQINLLSGTTRVQYWPDRVNINYIETEFANAGFDADDVKAEPDSYKNCRRHVKEQKKGADRKKVNHATCSPSTKTFDAVRIVLLSKKPALQLAGFFIALAFGTTSFF